MPLKLLKNTLLFLQFLFLCLPIFLINPTCSERLPADKNYQSEDVVFENNVAGFKLAGTLTYPERSRRFPAVILISGRGAQDRDETSGKHKPFLSIAEYLTENNIAVLRFDDRGFGQSGGEYDLSTTTKTDVVTDVAAAYDYLSHRPEIDTRNIGLIGHSEGGVIAAMVSEKIPNIGFIVLMASPGLKGFACLELQIGLVARSIGINESAIKKYQDIFQCMDDILRNETDDKIIQQKIFKRYSALSSTIRDDEREALKSIGYYLPKDPDVFFRIFKTPGWNDFFTCDPETIYQKVKCPILVVNGDKDLQVPSTAHLEAIATALKKGGHKNYTVLELPGLNHLFQSAVTGSPYEYEHINETISPAVLKIMKDWILTHIK